MKLLDTLNDRRSWLAAGVMAATLVAAPAAHAISVLAPINKTYTNVVADLSSGPVAIDLNNDGVDDFSILVALDESTLLLQDDPFAAAIAEFPSQGFERATISALSKGNTIATSIIGGVVPAAPCLGCEVLIPRTGYAFDFGDAPVGPAAEVGWSPSATLYDAFGGPLSYFRPLAPMDLSVAASVVEVPQGPSMTIGLRMLLDPLSLEATGAAIEPQYNYAVLQVQRGSVIVLQSSFQTQPNTPASLPAVPLPPALVLMGAGLAGLGALRRIRRPA